METKPETIKLTLPEYRSLMDGNMPQYLLEEFIRRGMQEIDDVLRGGTLQTLCRFYDSIRQVECTQRNVALLCKAYNQQFAKDTELFELICKARKKYRNEVPPINRVTEPHTEAEMAELLRRENTVTFMLPDPNDPDDPPLGFFILQHAGTTGPEIRRFAEHMRNEECTRSKVSARGDRDHLWKEYEEGLERGDHVYVTELISGENKLASEALIAALDLKAMRPLERARSREFAGITARCLEKGRIGLIDNPRGNLRIQDLNGKIGIHPIADLPPLERELEIPWSLVREYFHTDQEIAEGGIVGDEDSPALAKVPAYLTFSLNYGRVRHFRNSLMSLNSFRYILSIAHAAS